LQLPGKISLKLDSNSSFLSEYGRLFGLNLNNSSKLQPLTGDAGAGGPLTEDFSFEGGFFLI